MLIQRRYVNAALQGGMGGDSTGVIVGFLNPTDIGAPFNGGTVAATSTADTDLILCPGFNNFMLIESHAGVSVNWRLETVDPETGTIYFDDLIGAGAVGTNRLNWGAPAGGIRSSDPFILIRVRCQNTNAAAATAVTLRIWFSARGG